MREGDILFKVDFDDDLIDALAVKIANRATEILEDRIHSMSNDLPLVLTREEAMQVLRVGATTMSELMRRPDFPVNREFGIKIPSHMLMKWIEQHTRWMEQNSNYFQAI
jgi:hypothetical protein